MCVFMHLLQHYNTAVNEIVSVGGVTVKSNFLNKIFFIIKRDVFCDVATEFINVYIRILHLKVSKEHIPNI
jgi:hypothetical protein